MSQDITIYTASLSCFKEHYHDVVSTLTPQEMRNFETYCFLEDRLRFAIGRCMLRTELALYTGLDKHALHFDYTPFGKPFLLYPHAPYFNLSHSQDLIVAAFSDYDLGIDIEFERDIRDDMITDLFFSPLEVQHLLSLPPQEKKSSFYSLWTYKEAYLKAIGLGMSYDPTSVDVLHQKTFNFKDKIYNLCPILEIGSGYSCALCYTTKETPQIRIIPFHLS